MATNEIKLGINLRQNKNSKNAGYGKYYPEVDTQTTLTLRGFAKHMSDHGSIYSLDLIEGVLKKITQCLPELISQGVPVRLDPLGTSHGARHGVTEKSMLDRFVSLLYILVILINSCRKDRDYFCNLQIIFHKKVCAR